MFIACPNLIAANPPCQTTGMAVADLDGDGVDEVLVAGWAGPNRVLKWDGERLADTTPPLLADPQRNAAGVACGDLDGDGREEIYIVNNDVYGGPKQVSDRLYACFGKRWIDLLTLPENTAAASRHAGRSVAVIDREGIGRYGFAVTGFGGPLRLLELDRTGRLVDVAEEAGVDAVCSARSLLAAPILGELPDLFVGCELGPNLLFRNCGDGTFEELAGRYGLADPREGARGAGLIDVDGDGLFDIVLGNWQGPLRLFQQRAGGGFTDTAGEDLARPGPVRTVILADVDNDGYEEVFVHLHGAPNRLFGWREEQWVPLDIGDAAEPDGFGTGAVVADLDGDGQLELLLGHGEGAAQPLSLFIAEPRGHGWLRVRPLTRAGAPARGALVTLRAGGRTQRRVIDAGSGYLCQMEPVAHFGLGTLTALDRLTVRWPDGAVLHVDHPAPNQTLILAHPEA